MCNLAHIYRQTSNLIGHKTPQKPRVCRARAPPGRQMVKGHRPDFGAEPRQCRRRAGPFLQSAGRRQAVLIAEQLVAIEEDAGATEPAGASVWVGVIVRDAEPLPHCCGGYAQLSWSDYPDVQSWQARPIPFGLFDRETAQYARARVESRRRGGRRILRLLRNDRIMHVGLGGELKPVARKLQPCGIIRLLVTFAAIWRWLRLGGDVRQRLLTCNRLPHRTRAGDRHKFPLTGVLSPQACPK